jgi:hypothetical protein
MLPDNYSLGTDVIAVGHILIVQETNTGRAPVWLVVFTYSKLCQSVAYTGISIFVVSNVLGLELPFGASSPRRWSAAPPPGPFSRP